MAVSRRIVLHFPKHLIDQPIVYRLVRDYDLRFNILKANFTPEEEGLMVMEVTGERRNYDKGIKFLTGSGVKIQPLSRDVTRNEERCTHCGACITVCPTGAFELNVSTRQVRFYGKKCSACGLCIKACPPRAMELRF